jgi:hypothetical protein
MSVAAVGRALSHLESMAARSCRRSSAGAASGAHTAVCVSAWKVEKQLTLEPGSFWNPAPMTSAQRGCSNSTDGGTIVLGMA